MFYKLCAPANLECHWCLLFSAKIACIKIWRMAILTWTKPGNNLDLFGIKKMGTLLYIRKEKVQTNELT